MRQTSILIFTLFQSLNYITINSTKNMIVYKVWKIIIKLNSPNKYGLAAENLNNIRNMIIYKFWKIIINLNSPNKYGLEAESLNNRHQQHKTIFETYEKDRPA